MYKLEYLAVSNSDKTECKTINAIKHLLQVNSNIKIKDNKISHKGYSSVISIKQGTSNDESHIFFNISLTCINEEDIDDFTALTKSIRSSLSTHLESIYVIWNDLSLYFANKAYPQIFEIENQMRLLITKFMLTTLGLGWVDDRVPVDVKNSVRIKDKDKKLNNSLYLENVDFIQLKNFLFSENFPTHKEKLIKELKRSKDFSNLNIEEIKTLLPESNWDRFFESLVGCDSNSLKKKWDRLYELRCMVAHNKDFNKSNLKEVSSLSTELKEIIAQAIESLDGIFLSDEEVDTVEQVDSILESIKSQRPRQNFFEMGMVAGDVLDYTLGPITCQIASASRVKYGDKTLSLTALTQQLRNSTQAVRPANFWTFKGRKLSEIYDEVYPLENTDTE